MAKSEASEETLQLYTNLLTLTTSALSSGTVTYTEGGQTAGTIVISNAPLSRSYTINLVY